MSSAGDRQYWVSFGVGGRRYCRSSGVIGVAGPIDVVVGGGRARSVLEKALLVASTEGGKVSGDRGETDDLRIPENLGLMSGNRFCADFEMLGDKHVPQLEDLLGGEMLDWLMNGRLMLVPIAAGRGRLRLAARPPRLSACGV